MTKKHIRYKYGEIYALYYRSNNTLYYNLNFDERRTKIIIFR